MNLTTIPLLVISLLIIGFAMSMVKNIKALWAMAVITTGASLVISCKILMDFNHDNFVSLNMFSGFGISFATTELGAIFAIVASVLWLVSAVATNEYFDHHTEHLTRYYSSLIVTFAGTMGVFYAGDLFTLFVFFEIMSFTSYLWVAHSGTQSTTSAANSYLAYGLFGGLSLLFGIFILYHLTGDLTLSTLTDLTTAHQDNPMLLIAIVLIFIGFGAKAGVFTLHDWLPVAHTAAPAPASGLLSGLLTKTGVYGIILITLKIMSFSTQWINFLLIISMFNMVIGGIFAFFSNNLKRTLAYSSVSQIGFILWGVSLTVMLGDHNTYAAYGTLYHMINHSLIKILLFSCAGIIYQNTHTLDLNQLKGYGKNKPWLMVAFAVGALSLMGVPLFSGYASKTLLHEAMVEMVHLTHQGIYTAFEWVFLISGGITFAYMLKLFICLFIENPPNQISSCTKSHYVSFKTMVMLSSIAAIIIIFGVVPNQTFDVIGEFASHFLGTHSKDIHYFIWINLKGSLISAAIGTGLYLLVARKTVASPTKGYRDYGSGNISLETLIYKPLFKGLSFSFAVIFRTVDISVDVIIVIINRVFFKSVAIPKTFFEGKPRFIDRDRAELHITYSLSYSLLLFGVGFICTLAYLLIVGSN